MKYVTVAPTAGCCGVVQICHMQDYSTAGSANDYWHATEYSGNTYQEALESALRPYDDGQLVQIWFVKRHRWDAGFEDEFDAQELLDYVSGIDGVVSLGEFENPNSNNLIAGYQWEKQ